MQSYTVYLARHHVTFLSVISFLNVITKIQQCVHDKYGSSIVFYLHKSKKSQSLTDSLT